MSSPPHANELANRLDQVLPPHSQAVSGHVPGVDPLVDAAARLAQGPFPVLAADVVERIQAQVLARVDQKPRLQVVSRRRSNFYVLRWAAAACLVLVVLAVGTATVSAQSLPGDTLYPVKRLVERGRLALSSDEAEVNLRLDYANRRLDEFEDLLDDGEINFDTLDDAIDDMNTTLKLVTRGEGSTQDAADRLLGLSQRQIELAQTATEQAEQNQTTVERLREASAKAEQVNQQARSLIEAPRGFRIPPPEPLPGDGRAQGRDIRKPTSTMPLAMLDSVVSAGPLVPETTMTIVNPGREFSPDPDRPRQPETTVFVQTVPDVSQEAEAPALDSGPAQTQSAPAVVFETPAALNDPASTGGNPAPDVAPHAVPAAVDEALEPVQPGRDDDGSTTNDVEPVEPAPAPDDVVPNDTTAPGDGPADGDSAPVNDAPANDNTGSANDNTGPANGDAGSPSVKPAAPPVDANYASLPEGEQDGRGTASIDDPPPADQENAPADDPPVDDDPAEEIPPAQEETPQVEETPPAEDSPAEQPAVEAPAAEEVPPAAEIPPADEVSPAVEEPAPAGQAPADAAPAVESPVDELPVEQAPADTVPAPESEPTG
ncbi:MAG: hypothetical protein JW966_13010 [Anaerolineae bacterium]|nr:hypothetical protein [Anaerolineae bacterium]